MRYVWRGLAVYVASALLLAAAVLAWVASRPWIAPGLGWWDTLRALTHVRESPYQNAAQYVLSKPLEVIGSSLRLLALVVEPVLLVVVIGLGVAGGLWLYDRKLRPK